ncbi:MAG: aminopeptidase, partial [Clostridiales bacterium]|nr:aminopeptidase [Clostridiales bacterium]
PRLDLKPNPLYEKNEIAYFKTHYYGGIRKYQWGTVPLAMHGVVVKKNGEKITICVGEEAGDPVFCISDLLPHLAAKQNERRLSEGLKGEELNIIVGSLPFVDDKVKEPVKLMALKLLNEKYGITEADFFRAEIEMVPAQKAVDVGLDRSMIGAYGQDDRVCAYTALMAEFDAKEPAYTTVTVLTDKEEIGSEGNTGMVSDYLKNHIEYLAQMEYTDPKEVFHHSMCLSADVNAAFDPTFSDVFEANNSSYLNKGCVLTKYTGARGKSGSNDASAETMAAFIAIMEENGVYWQSGELGAVDLGGGGTIAKFIARLDIDVVDLGVPVLSMHAPFEITAKLDVYHTYKAFQAFYR